jgi:hypothetical protein
MLSYNSPIIVNKNILSQLRNNNNTFSAINNIPKLSLVSRLSPSPSPNPNDIYIMIPFVSLFSFLAGYYYAKL